MGKEAKTNAMRMLEKKKIPYEAVTYECDEFIGRPAFGGENRGSGGRILQNAGDAGEEPPVLCVCDARLPWR